MEIQSRKWKVVKLAKQKEESVSGPLPGAALHCGTKPGHNETSNHSLSLKLGRELVSEGANR